MYKITAGDAKWQECTMTDEELNEAVDRARQIKLLSTLGLTVADLADLKAFLQQKRDQGRSAVSAASEDGGGEGEAAAAKKRKTGE